MKIKTPDILINRIKNSKKLIKGLCFLFLRRISENEEPTIRPY